MERLLTLVDYVLHLNRYLPELASQYGHWMYGILCLILFCETGLIITPFLPGDSLLFAAGSLCALGQLNVHLLAILLFFSVMLGDNTNYGVGFFLGQRLFDSEKNHFFKKAYLNKTHEYYEKYGSKTIIIARFVPILRTFAPFAAGLGTMRYLLFLCYNVVGAMLWIGGFLYAGYWLGNLPFFQKNFSWMILLIVIVSLLPLAAEFIQHQRRKIAASKAQ